MRHTLLALVCVAVSTVASAAFARPTVDTLFDRAGGVTVQAAAISGPVTSNGVTKARLGSLYRDSLVVTDVQQSGGSVPGGWEVVSNAALTAFSRSTNYTDTAILAVTKGMITNIVAGDNVTIDTPVPGVRMVSVAGSSVPGGWEVVSNAALTAFSRSTNYTDAAILSRIAEDIEDASRDKSLSAYNGAFLYEMVTNISARENGTWRTVSTYVPRLEHYATNNYKAALIANERATSLELWRKALTNDLNGYYFTSTNAQLLGTIDARLVPENETLSNTIVRVAPPADISGKRDTSDRAVYSVTRTENTDWVWTSDNAELAAALNEASVKPIYDSENHFWVITGTTHWGKFYYNSPGVYDVDALSVRLAFITIPGYVDYYATASRPRYIDEETLGPAKPNQQLAAVATGDAQTPTNNCLVKYDAANDRLVKATAGTDYADGATKTELAAKRDLTNNVCRKTEFAEWICNPPRTEFGGVYSVRYDSEVKVYTLFDNEYAVEEIGSPTDDKMNLEFVGYCTATRSAVCTSNELFVTQSFVTNAVNAANSTNNPAFVSAVRAVVDAMGSFRAYDRAHGRWYRLQVVNGTLEIAPESKTEE